MGDKSFKKVYFFSSRISLSQMCSYIPYVYTKPRPIWHRLGACRRQQWQWGTFTMCGNVGIFFSARLAHEVCPVVLCCWMPRYVQCLRLPEIISASSRYILFGSTPIFLQFDTGVVYTKKKCFCIKFCLFQDGGHRRHFEMVEITRILKIFYN